MEFEWDKEKAESNVQRHGVSFHEASTVFGDPLAITFHDPEHSTDETRYITFRLSMFNHLMVVSHTDRKKRIRIISARFMTKKERKIYEDG